MIVRRATPADAATLADLGARTFHDTFARDNTPEDMAAFLAKTYGETQQRRELEDANLITILAEENGVAIAFMQLHRAPLPDEENAVEIARFYVDRAWHGRGVAQTMMAEAKRIARELGADAVWLAVWERNPRAIAFYEKCGFRDAGAKPFIVGSDVQTDRVMVAKLDD
ncbi:MAG TPA: GNAT family N-acetyltransferase [Thermoanaerobaculia bacterium]|nr:GNAT family N-acetyltransferase [Thermoanaerobaculia bacterium]